MKRKTKVEPTPVKARAYHLMSQAVSDGLAYGWSRAHKHTENPDVPHILECMENAVMLEIDQWFDFGDE